MSRVCVWGGGNGVPGRRAALSPDHEWFTLRGGGEYTAPELLLILYFILCIIYQHNVLHRNYTHTHGDLLKNFNQYSYLIKRVQDHLIRRK